MSSEQKKTGGSAAEATHGHSAEHGMTGPSFDNIYSQKRSTHDSTGTSTMSAEKRENLADQKPKGVLGSIWQSAMSGPGGPAHNAANK
ncbi:hypothetical protein F4808DRAFT_467190 [Astrocystis sublimbata]|nr:hypothetical protein F4808DRAFT_467190 [Astrocystis sublimbata]